LAKKPVPKSDKTDKTDKKPEKKVDPFENPKGDLFISQIPVEDPTHVLVLNKFPIIEGHFILATKEFKTQTDDLEAVDLSTTFACLESWEDGNQNARSTKLFAFFNSGPHSGASQPHRHIQFLPISGIQEGYHNMTPHVAALLSSGNGNLIFFGLF
jgi:ATP adenylyltransferase